MAATSKAKGALTSMPILPTSMPDLDVGGDDEDDGEDPQDENHLMNILHKLKSAKNTLDGTRQKKKANQMIDQTSARFIADAEELVSKHNKRWVGKHGLIQQKVKKLRTVVDEKQKSWEHNSKTSEKKLSAYKIRVKNILQSLSNMEKGFKETKEASDAATVAEVGRIRQQVVDKLKQMQGLLIKTHSRSIKDDKFTKIIKSFIASF